jgi:hypothetical protein
MAAGSDFRHTLNPEDGSHEKTGVPCRNGNVHPDARLERRVAHFAVVDREGLGDLRRGHHGDPGAHRALHHLGTPVLEGHRGLLQRAFEHQGVGLARRFAPVGDHRRPAHGALQLSEQRHADQLPGHCRRCRRWRRHGEGIRPGGFLAVHRGVQHHGRHLRGARDARPVPHAALHPAVARLADRSAHRGLARRKGLLPGTLHRRHHRQPRPAHPAPRPTTRTTPPGRRCCSARSARSSR